MGPGEKRKDVVEIDEAPAFSSDPTLEAIEL